MIIPSLHISQIQPTTLADLSLAALQLQGLSQPFKTVVQLPAAATPSQSAARALYFEGFLLFIEADEGGTAASLFGPAAPVSSQLFALALQSAAAICGSDMHVCVWLKGEHNPHFQLEACWTQISEPNWQEFLPFSAALFA